MALVSWMASANDTLLLRRRSARAAYRMNAEIRARLGERQSVVVFPEGTTTDRTRVLNVYPGLFQPAVDRDLPVLPLAISYRDHGERTATAVAYVDDDSLWKSLCAVLDARALKRALCSTAPCTRRAGSGAIWLRPHATRSDARTSGKARRRARTIRIRRSSDPRSNRQMHPIEYRGGLTAGVASPTVMRF
jgi:hypothetical protein